MVTVLAIDQGTTSIKAVVVGFRGAVLARASKAIATKRGAEGKAEQVPQEIWDAILETGRRAIEQARRPIDAVALANQGESVLAFDPSTGTPLTNLITWQDRRSQQLCRDLGARAELVHKATGLGLEPYYSAPKMAWIRQEMTGEGVVSTGDAWLLSKLTGVFATDAATASRSLLVDLESGRWNRQLQDVFGLGREQKPEIVANDAVIGTTTAFGREVPVAGAILDQPAALLAQGCLRQGEMKLTMGTGGFLLRNAGTEIRAGQDSSPISTAWEVRGQRTLCEDWPIYSVASALTWLASLGLLDSSRQLDRGCARGGPGNVVFVPGLDEPGGAGFLGLTASARREHMVSAAVYGIATQVADLLERANLAPDSALRVDGGLTGSRVMMQALADITRHRIQLYSSADATAMGAAMLAQLALTDAEDLPALLGARSPESMTTLTPMWAPEDAAGYRNRVRALAQAIAAHATEPRCCAQDDG